MLAAHLHKDVMSVNTSLIDVFETSKSLIPSSFFSLDDGMNNSMNLMDEIGTVLSAQHGSVDSEDIKSALIELLKAIRSTNSPMAAQKLKSLLPSVIGLLKHSEVWIPLYIPYIVFVLFFCFFVFLITVSCDFSLCLMN